MPIVREFRGKRVKRTKKKGERILVIFYGAAKGMPGQQIEISLADFMAERRADHRGDPHSER